MDDKFITISVILCCHNSTQRLNKTLLHLAKQKKVSNAKIEIILVDNASTDNTGEFARNIWHDYGNPYELKIIKENQPGLSYARKAGVLAANGTIGIFCDDDNWLNESYIEEVLTTFEKYPKIGIIGGASAANLEIQAPPWFYTNCYAYAVGIQAPQSCDITYRGYVWGAGMAFRTHLLKEIYKNPDIEILAIGRKLNSLASGDDSEICAWYIFYGYKLYYNSNMKFIHSISTNRLTDEYRKRFTAENQKSIWIYYYNYLILKCNILKIINPNKKRLVISFLKYLRALYSYAFERYEYAAIKENYKKIVKLREIIKNV